MSTWPSITVQPELLLERILTLEIVRVTERAAVSAARLRGRGKDKASDQAAVDAMRRELNKSADRRHGGDRRGRAATKRRCCSSARRSATRRGPKVDIAVDPLEGTMLCAKNMPGAIATLAMADQRHAAARAGLLHGQDRHRPRLSEGHHRSRRVGRRKHHQPRQGQGREAVGDHRHPARPAAPRRQDRRDPQSSAPRSA